MTLTTEETRITELLSQALRHLARGLTVAEAAARVGVPATTLNGWLISLDRAEAKHRRGGGVRDKRGLVPSGRAALAFSQQHQPINTTI